MSSESTQLRYMSRFRCIAERCEDSCCSGLRVSVSEPQWRRMKEATASHPEETRRLEEYAALNPGGSVSEHAYLQMRPDGNCPLLDTDRLCSLQRRHGEAVLPDICATFPRTVAARGERVELTGTLACPEVTRLCLLAEDAVEAMPLSVAGLAQSARPALTRHLPEDLADAARPHLLRLMHRRDYPLASRIALLGHLAHALDASGEEDNPSWDEVLQRFDDPDVLDALHQEFSALELPGGALVGLFHTVLRARQAAGRGARFDTLVRGVQESLGLSEASPETLEAAWRTYVERWRHVEAAHGERLHQYFHNYAIHSLWRVTLTDAPSLLAHVFRLALRVGLLRLTLMGHPSVAALVSTSIPDARERLDAAAVETFQLITKNVESSPDFATLATGLVGSGRGPDALGRVLVFATF